MADCVNEFYGTLRARWKVLMESKARSCCSSACLTRYTYTSFLSCTESKNKTHPKKTMTSQVKICCQIPWMRAGTWQINPILIQM